MDLIRVMKWRMRYEQATGFDTETLSKWSGV